MQPPLESAHARDQLLEAAGAVFAEKGYDRSTSKEICEQAGMNSSAVNYHFDGIDKLYAAVLTHAHRGFITIEGLQEIALSNASPKDKLRAVIEPIVRRLMLPSGMSWEMRLLSREIVAPTSAREQFVNLELLPKVNVVRTIVGEYLGVSPMEPVAGRSILTMIAPCLILAITQRGTLVAIAPELAHPETEVEPLVDHFYRFISAGLDAIASGGSKTNLHAMPAASRRQPENKPLAARVPSGILIPPRERRSNGQYISAVAA